MEEQPDGPYAADPMDLELENLDSNVAEQPGPRIVEVEGKLFENSNGAEGPEEDDAAGPKKCQCKKAKCLKLYCVCFSRGEGEHWVSASRVLAVTFGYSQQPFGRVCLIMGPRYCKCSVEDCF